MKGPGTEIDGSHNHHIKGGELTQVRRERGKVVGYRARNGKWIDRETASTPEPLKPIANAQEEIILAVPHEPKVRMRKGEKKQLLLNRYAQAMREKGESHQ
jgi:hypothetical protein